MSKIKFIEDSHKYLNEQDIELISVSAFMDQFKEKVDWGLIAAKSAAKLTREGKPTTKQDLLNKWENKRNISAFIGTTYHNFREDSLMNENNPTFYNTVCNTKACEYKGKDKFSIPITEIENNTVYPELMIYDNDYMICGQSDKVIVTDNKINIWDYKTDATIEFRGFTNKWKKVAKKYLPPISHLEECNANTYSLKMSLYMYMLWKANKGRFKPGDIIIEHIHLKRDPKNDNIPILDKQGKPIVLKIEQIKLPYRKTEVINMLNAYKNKTNI